MNYLRAVPAHHRASVLLQRTTLGSKGVQLACYAFGDGSISMEWRVRYANGTLAANSIPFVSSGRPPPRPSPALWATPSQTLTSRELCSAAARDPSTSSLAADADLLLLDEEAAYAAGVERLRRAALEAVPEERCQMTRLEMAEATRDMNGSYACLATNDQSVLSGLRRPRFAIANFTLLVQGTSTCSACRLESSILLLQSTAYETLTNTAV